MSSAYCLQMIKKYENAKSKIVGLYGYVDDCTSAISLGKVYTDRMIISGITIDNGKLSNFSSALTGIRSDLETIAAECDEWIAYWNQMYQEALRREAEEAENTPESARVWS